MHAADEAAEEHQQPETVDASLLSGDMSDCEQAKSSLGKQQRQDRSNPHRESDEEQRGVLDSAIDEHEEQQDEHDEEDEEVDDDEDSSALKKAARAGIRLLEENAQLADEVRHLQLQLTHSNEHCLELQRVLEEKDAQMEQLTQHLRESICENQSVLCDLNQMKEQVTRYKMLLVVQDQQQSQHSPRMQNTCTWPPTRNVQLQQQLVVRVLDDEGALSSQSGSSDESQTTTADVPVIDYDDFNATSNGKGRSRSPSPLGPISPKRRQAARLEEVETKFEEAHRRNIILKMELTSAQKKVSELKPLNAQLHEAKEESQVLRHEIEKLERELNLSLEERAEESMLIQSLRTTIEIYQSLDDPSRSAKSQQYQQSGFQKSALFAEADDDDQTRRLSKMRRRRSDGCIIPLTTSLSTAAAAALKQPPTCWTNTVDDCFHTRDESEVALESLDGLVDQLLSLQQQQEGSLAVQSEASRAKDNTIVATVATWPRIRFLEQQVMVLQDLLRRYRAQWRQSTEKRSSLEIENGNLLSRIEALNMLVQRQCELCTRASEGLTKENEAWKAAASVYETLLMQAADAQDSESEAESEHRCFSILRHLVDSWTGDKSKSMKLHDWLTNAIRGTGRRKPLYLPDLSGEIASGFQMLLVPILRHRFGVDVRIEKRLRNVVVTDLKLHVDNTDAEKAKACLQRISRSLMWLVDIESAQINENEWMGGVSRKKAALRYQGK